MGDAQDQINTRALELSAMAMQAITAHERVCESRQKAIMDTLERQDESRDELRREIREHLQRIYSVMWKAAIGLIAVLLACVGFFVSRDILPTPAHSEPAVVVGVP